MEMRISRIGKRIRRILSGKEAGAALPAVLAFLVLGALIITPLLGFMITGLKAGQSHEKRTGEFYSADAGVDYAIWQLQYGSLLEEDYVWPSNPLQLTPTPLSINNDSVDVWIEDLGEGLRFKITSTATDNATGSATTVVTRVVPDVGYQGNYFANGITAVGDITLKGDVEGDVECAGTLTTSPGTVIDGNVKCMVLDNGGTIIGDVECGILNNKGDIIGAVKYYEKIAEGTIIPGPPIQMADPPDMSFIDNIWPSKDKLDGFYLPQVTDNWEDESTWYPFMLIKTCGELPLIGSYKGVYTGYGDKKPDDPRGLTIDTKDPDCAVKLTTTVFVTGDFEVTPNTLLDLNGQTVYVHGDIKFSPGSLLTGSGVIIAIGQIDFQPGIVSGGDSSDEAVIMHRGDLFWVRQTNTYVGDLNDVWGISPGEVYAVGNGGLVLEYDGMGWSDVITPLSLLSSPPDLNGVWCNPVSGDVFAVGNSGTTLRYDAVACNWTYEVVGAASLNDVWGSVSDNAVYAVGDGGSAFRWQDGNWTAMQNDSLLGLNGVWGSESENVLIAVGDGGTMRKCTDGQIWLEWSDSGSGTPKTLNAIWGVSESEFYVVGGAIMGEGDGIIRRWKVVEGVGAWTTMSIDSGIRPVLRDIWGTSASDIYAVGEQGSIIRYFGVGPIWSHVDPMTVPTTRNLNGIWGTGANDIFVVGQAVQDFVFVQSVDSFVKHLPNGDFHGSIAGKGECVLQPGSSLQAPSDLGRVNFPNYRYMRMESYVIEQH